LLRGGRRMPRLDPSPASPYTLMVCRAGRAPDCTVWPAHYRRPLPPIPIPLAAPDPGVSLDLQPLVAALYERHRYARSIDYRRPLDPPLPPEDAAWLAERLLERR